MTALNSLCIYTHYELESIRTHALCIVEMQCNSVDCIEEYYFAMYTVQARLCIMHNGPDELFLGIFRRIEIAQPSSREQFCGDFRVVRQ